MKKIIWSALSLSLLLLGAGCSKEQFGTTPQSNSSQASPVNYYEQLSCSTFTLIKPKVDILYVVDNSQSSLYMAQDIKASISTTVDSISKDFDYRVIGTPLLASGSSPFSNYLLLTNSQDYLSNEAVGKKIIKTSEFNFFSNNEDTVTEAGLGRIVDFINYNISNNSGIFRNNSYLIVVLISNGRDNDVEYSPYSNASTLQYTSVYNARKDAIIGANGIKKRLNSQQLRLLSATANGSCNRPGWLSSEKSYIQMSRDLYDDSGAQDSNSNRDRYDLCADGVSGIFSAINSSIKQVLIPHSYRYWPITFAKGTDTRNTFGDIQVYKVSGNSAPALMPSSSWAYYENTSGQPLNTREAPTPGEPISGKHFVKFTNLVTYPDCVQIKSISRTEYFGYIVLPKAPDVSKSIVVRINGKDISGWSYRGFLSNQNVKMPYPKAGDQDPAVNKTGFMIQINDPANYYKSGDNVEVHYIPAAI